MTRLYNDVHSVVHTIILNEIDYTYAPVVPFHVMKKIIKSFLNLFVCLQMGVGTLGKFSDRNG